MISVNIQYTGPTAEVVEASTRTHGALGGHRSTPDNWMYRFDPGHHRRVVTAPAAYHGGHRGNHFTQDGNMAGLTLYGAPPGRYCLLVIRKQLRN